MQGTNDLNLPAGPGDPEVSVLIPARNESARIGRLLQSVLSNCGVRLEVCVLDDESTDGTAEIVQGFAAADSRVRLLDDESTDGTAGIVTGKQIGRAHV